MLPGLFLLLLVLGPNWAKEQECPMAASSCDECIMSGPDCAWCMARGALARCDTLQGLQEAGCQQKDVYFPQGLVARATESHSPSPDPNHVHLYLRPGVNQSFPMVISQPSEQLALNISNVPAGFNISFDFSPKGNPRIVQVNVEAARCPSKDQNGTGSSSVLIATNLAPQRLMLKITLLCQCDCTQKREDNSGACSGRGALLCGRCECRRPYFGLRCQKREGEVSFAEHEQACRSGPAAPVCSGRGSCEEGFCYCDTPVNPSEIYSGRFCECSNFQCPWQDNKMCGGRGRCECGTCLCDEGWTGEACSCTVDATGCTAANQQLCSGRGSCVCGACRCEPPFTGPTCEQCPTCPGECDQLSACVECRAFGTALTKSRCDRECGPLSLIFVETSQDLPDGDDTRLCRKRSSADSCVFFFTYSRLPPGGQVTVVRAKQCPAPFK